MNTLRIAMKNFCIETENLQYAFSSSETILRNINLQVEEGSIYGFLGPNGAGKTTTMRLLLGLLKKQEGQVRIFNKDLEQHRIAILRQTGSLIESPSLYSHLTAFENLALLCKVFGISVKQIEPLLQLVGLECTGNKKAGQFSLGMKQRLSIAVALLNNPKLLVLDEPTNGLDPAGIIEIREMLKNINRQHGITILVSSHLLAEIEKLVTHVGVIHKGSLLFQGTLKELKAKQEQTSLIYFDTGDEVSTLRIIRDNNQQAYTENGKVVLPLPSKETIAVITRQLVQKDIPVYGVQTVQHDLETIFMNLTNN